MKMVKWKPQVEKAWVPWTEIGFGQVIFACFVPNHIAPIGLVWGWREGPSAFVVAGSYVEPWARRFGVRTRINVEILKQTKIIRTVTGSKTGGTAFMQARGYVHAAALGLWYLNPAMNERKVNESKGRSCHAKSKAKR